jgi:hypothetical protein
MIEKPVRLGTVVIIGGGTYGTKALQKLQRIAQRIVVVDHNQACKAGLHVDQTLTTSWPIPIGTSLVVSDGASYLQKAFATGAHPDYIVTSAPGNTLASLFNLWIKNRGFGIEPDPSLLEKVSLSREYIVTTDTHEALLIASYARGYFCSPACSEGALCPISNEPREVSMHRIINESIHGCSKEIFLSSLLDLEVGAVMGKSILEAFERVDSLLGHGLKLAVGTACKCHGIVSFMKVA